MTFIKCKCGNYLDINKELVDFLKELQLHGFGEFTLNELVDLEKMRDP